ncbi:MAG: GNAT family N-acetyltransferase [Parachlamydiaceae bacterium]|nr:GNAT family N-acetyltransferase [Parachlamydiaceae bacterium]
MIELQSSLIVDNQAISELVGPFKENGFLIIRMERENLMETLLSGGKIVTSRHQNQLIGYLILCTEDSFKWLLTAESIDIKIPLNIDELVRYITDNHILEIDQIAVAHTFAKQGIGRKMVEIAKQEAPHGLATCILYKPFTNEASYHSFQNKILFMLSLFT